MEPKQIYSERIEANYRAGAAFDLYSREARKALENEDIGYLSKALVEALHHLEGLVKAKDDLDWIINQLEIDEIDSIEEFLDSTEKVDNVAKQGIKYENVHSDFDETQYAVSMAIYENYETLEDFRRIYENSSFTGNTPAAQVIFSVS